MESAGHNVEATTSSIPVKIRDSKSALLTLRRKPDKKLEDKKATRSKKSDDKTDTSRNKIFDAYIPMKSNYGNVAGLVQSLHDTATAFWAVSFTPECTDG